MVHLLDPNMLVPVCRLEDPLSWSLSVLTTTDPDRVTCPECLEGSRRIGWVDEVQRIEWRDGS